MRFSKRAKRNTLITTALTAVGVLLGTQVAVALWDNSVDSPTVNVLSGDYSGEVTMNGTKINTVAAGDTHETKEFTLSQGNVDSLVATGKVAIPLSITTSISGQAAMLPLMTVTAANWNNDSDYIEPSWRLYKVAEGETCSYDVTGNPNFISGENSVTLNGDGNSNSNPYLAGKYDTKETAAYNFCLVGTTPEVDCDSGKIAIHSGYDAECGTYTNKGTLKFDKYDGSKGEVSVTDTFDKVTQEYDWSDWGTAVAKDTPSGEFPETAVRIKLGYKVVPFDDVSDYTASSTNVANLATLGIGETPTSPVITTASVPDATLGVTYKADLKATGDDVGYMVTKGDLPSGLLINQDTGELGGKPTSVESATFTIAAVNPSGSATRTFKLEVDPVAPIISTTSGFYFSVSLDEDGRAWSWGQNSAGQLGNGAYTDVYKPEEVIGDYNFTQVDAGGYHVLALDKENRLWAWGQNADGQLGVGNEIPNSPKPILVSETMRFKSIAANERHSLALDTNGKLWAWGRNDSGQLGVGDKVNRLTPTRVKPDYSFTAIAAGTYHGLAIDTNGDTWAWGANGSGQLGNATFTESVVPVRVSGGVKFTSIEAGAARSVALDTTGKAWAWGGNPDGTLGIPAGNKNIPTALTANKSFKTIKLTYGNVYALDGNGRLWAWGSNAKGELGTGATGIITTPTLVTPNNTYTAIAPGAYFIVALDSNKKLWSWGQNSYGQLGNGILGNGAGDPKIDYVTTPTLTNTVS